MINPPGTHPLCADIRGDAKIIAVGGKKGYLRIFNHSQPSGLKVMRSLQGHRSDIHDIRFQPMDNIKILTVSDDQRCCYWDMVAEKRVLSIHGHHDFVRSVCFHLFSSFLMMQHFIICHDVSRSIGVGVNQPVFCLRLMTTPSNCGTREIPHCLI